MRGQLGEIPLGENHSNVFTLDLIDNGFYDYEHKYTDGRTVHVCPADVPDDIAASRCCAPARATST